MTGSAIPLGEREGQLYRAYEVENGLACGCVCPACRKPLVAANQGEKRLPYFRHVEQDDCWQGRSEGMRRAAVQLIAQRQEILLPGYKDTVILTGRSGQVRSAEVAFSAKLIRVDQVERFVDLGDLRAHALLTYQERQLVVRIQCSARQEHERRRRLQAMDMSSIEIDLHWLSDADINDQARFGHAVLYASGNRSWIRCLRAERLKVVATERLKPQLEEIDDWWERQEQARLLAEQEQAEQLAIKECQRTQALEQHRDKQARLVASLLARSPPEVEDDRARREAQIVVTLLRAAREWGHRGVECSNCRLISPPDLEFCLYCDNEEQVSLITYSTDLERTLSHRLRSSAAPDQSIRRVKRLLVDPLLLYSDESSSEKKES